MNPTPQLSPGAIASSEPTCSSNLCQAPQPKPAVIGAAAVAGTQSYYDRMMRELNAGNRRAFWFEAAKHFLSKNDRWYTQFCLNSRPPKEIVS